MSKKIVKVIQLFLVIGLPIVLLGLAVNSLIDYFKNGRFNHPVVESAVYLACFLAVIFSFATVIPLLNSFGFALLSNSLFYGMIISWSSTLLAALLEIAR